MFARKLLIITMCSAILFSGCARNGENPDGDNAQSGMLVELAPVGGADAAGKFIDRNGKETGRIVFSDAPNAGVLLRVDLKGLNEGWHAIHFHNVGDCSDYADGFQLSGGHIDPDERQHGLMNDEGPERADLPNLYAGADGRATAEFFNDHVALHPSESSAAVAGPHPLIDDDGFAVVVHEAADDHHTQPIGGAGGRVACAAIDDVR